MVAGDGIPLSSGAAEGSGPVFRTEPRGPLAVHDTKAAATSAARRRRAATGASPTTQLPPRNVRNGPPSQMSREIVRSPRQDGWKQSMFETSFSTN